MSERVSTAVPHGEQARPAQPARDLAHEERSRPRLRLEALEERLTPGIDTTPSFRLP